MSCKCPIVVFKIRTTLPCCMCQHTNSVTLCIIRIHSAVVFNVSQLISLQVYIFASNKFKCLFIESLNWNNSICTINMHLHLLNCNIKYNKVVWLYIRTPQAFSIWTCYLQNSIHCSLDYIAIKKYRYKGTIHTFVLLITFLFEIQLCTLFSL